MLKSVWSLKQFGRAGVSVLIGALLAAGFAPSPAFAATYTPISCVSGTTVSEPLALTYDTTKLVSSTTINLQLGVISGTVNVDWGDGQVQVVTTAGNQAHTYATSGTYTVQVCGTVTTLGPNSLAGAYTPVAGAAALVAVEKFGDVGLNRLLGSFAGATNLTRVPATLPTTVQTMLDTFESATSFNDPNIKTWDTSRVTVMVQLFRNATSFNQDLGAWNTGAVVNMGGMFQGATAFNNGGSPAINNWNTANVTSTVQMFSYATSFNQPIGNWNVGKLVAAYQMFEYASAFNQPLGTWNTASLVRVDNMFLAASKFNQDIGAWNMSKVNSVVGMFREASAFNNGGSPSINNWNTALVPSFSQMFYMATVFNQPIGNWNTANATTLDHMFASNRDFNQPIGNWNVAKVTSLNAFVTGTNSFRSAFDQDLSNWNVSKVTDFQSAFSYTSFNNGGNPGISKWIINTTAPVKMLSMFSGSKFNQPIATWNTSQVTNMAYMFPNTPFNQPIGVWDTGNVTTVAGMFDGATAFDQDLSNWKFAKLVSDLSSSYYISMTGAFGFLDRTAMSVANYDKLLKKLYDTTTTANLQWTAGGVYFSCDGKQWRDKLITAGQHTNQVAIGYYSRYDYLTAIPAPTITSMVPGDTTLDVTFTTPTCYGGTFDDVKYSLDNGVTWTSYGSATNTLHLTGLTNGTTYPVRVKINDPSITWGSGWHLGPASPMVPGTPFGPPKTPLYVVPDTQSIMEGSTAPAAGFYTYSLYLDPANPASKVTPTLDTAPTCGSTFTNVMSTGVKSNAITCGGGSNSGSVGTDAVYSFVYTSKADLTVTPKPTLYVKPVDREIIEGDAVPAASFYTVKYYSDAAYTTEVAPTLTTAPTCGSTYAGTETAPATKTISCGGGSNSGTAGSDSGYNFDYSATGTLTVKPITPVPLYVVPQAKSISYSSSVPSASFYSVKYYLDAGHTSEVIPTLATAPTCGSAYAATDSAGSSDPITCGGGSNFGSAGSSRLYTFDYSATSTLTVTKADVTVAVTCSVIAVTYDGDVHEPCSVTVTRPGGSTLTPIPTYVGSTTDAGDVVAKYQYLGSANYNASDLVSQGFRINKASTTSLITCPASVVYDGTSQDPCSASVSGAALDLTDQSVSYSSGHTNVGTVTVDFHFDGDTNHFGSDADQVSFDIVKADSGVTISCPESVVFNGNDQKVCTYVVTRPGSSDLTRDLASGDYTGDTVNAGIVGAGYTYAGDSNHNGSSSSASYTISPVTTTITYNGDTTVAPGSTSVINLSALFSAPIGGCSGVVTYTITPDPATGTGFATVTASLGSILNTISLGSSPTASAFDIQVAYAGSQNCAAATGTGRFTFALPGNDAIGGGSYTYSTKGALVNFGYEVHRLTAQPRLVQGNLQWSQKDRWKWNGVIDSLNLLQIRGVQTGQMSGLGDLYYWSGKKRQWVIAARKVRGTAYVQATVDPTKQAAGTKGTFGISFDYQPGVGQPDLPPSIVAGPILLTGSNSVVR